MTYKAMEIGEARNQAVADILLMGVRAPKYILWLSDDELPEWDALIRLWIEMENSWSNGKHGWDALTSLVYLKQDPPEPVLWNKSIRADGHLIAGVDYNVGDVVESEVGDLGFGLMRTEIFTKIPAPWFHTGVSFKTNASGVDEISVHTEDAFFFEKMRDHKLCLGVATSIRTGHLDVATGVIY
jgi:hypothetical protein